MIEPHSAATVPTGFVRFKQSSATVVTATISGLAPNSKHGIHVHELGDLTNGCASLGAHWNPFGEVHGGLESIHRHAGDLGNIVANAEGIATLSVTDGLL